MVILIRCAQHHAPTFGRLIIAPTGAEEDGGRLIIAPTGAVDGFGCVTGVGAVINRPRSEEFR